MSQLSVTMSADEADLFAKLTSMIAKVAESEAAFKKAGETSSAAAAASKAAAEQAEAVARATAQAAKEQDAFAAGGKRLADQLLRSNETLEESYERQKTQIKAAHEAGKIGAKEHESALSVLQARHEQAKEAEEKAARESTEAHKRNQREIESGINLVDRLRVANTSLEDKYKQMAVEVTKAHQAGKITAEQHDRAIDQLKQEYDGLTNKQQTMAQKFEESALSMISRWGSVAAVVGLATEAITFQNEQIQKGIDLVKKQDEPFKNLTTVSADRMELTERIMQSEKLQTVEGMDAARAANMVFAMDSEGIIGRNKTTVENDAAVALFGNLNRFTNPETMVQVAGQMEKSFGMGVEESINLTLKAAETSKMTPSEMANQLAMASAGAAQFTGADQRNVAIETAAIVSGLTGVHGNRAGDIAKSAMMKLAGAFPDATPMEAARMANEMDAESRSKMFGEDQQLTIFLSDIARGGDRYGGLVGDVRSAADRSGTAESEIAKNLEIGDANPYSEQLRLANSKKARLEIANKKKSLIGLQNEGDSESLKAESAEMEIMGFAPNFAGGPWIPSFVKNRLIDVMATGANMLGVSANENIPQMVEQENNLRSQVESKRSAELELLKQIAANTQNQSPPPLPPVTRPGDDR